MLTQEQMDRIFEEVFCDLDISEHGKKDIRHFAQEVMNALDDVLGGNREEFVSKTAFYRILLYRMRRVFQLGRNEEFFHLRSLFE